MTADQLIEAFEKMTVLELSEFKKAFEEKFGVTAAAPRPAARPPRRARSRPSSRPFSPRSARTRSPSSRSSAS
jgi:ribosomal protein L7/L12